MSIQDRLKLESVIYTPDLLSPGIVGTACARFITACDDFIAAGHASLACGLDPVPANEKHNILDKILKKAAQLYPQNANVLLQHLHTKSFSNEDVVNVSIFISRRSRFISPEFTAILFKNKVKNGVQRCLSYTDDKCSELAFAIKNDDLDKLVFLSGEPKFDINKDIIIPADTFFVTHWMKPVMYAARCGAIKCFKWMLLNNVKLDVATWNREDNSRLPVMFNLFDCACACSNNNFEILHLLLQYDLKPHKYTMYIASLFHKNDILEWLFNHCCSHMSDAAIWNTFKVSTFKYENFEAIRTLLKTNYVRLGTLDNNVLNSLITFCIENGFMSNADKIGYLLCHDIHEMYAYDHMNVDVITLLAGSRPSLNNEFQNILNNSTQLLAFIRNPIFDNVCECIVEYKMYDIFSLILDKLDNINLMLDNNCTIAQYLFKQVIELDDATSFDVIKELVNHNADLNSANLYGNTPAIHCLKRAGATTTMHLLSAITIDVNIRNKNNLTLIEILINESPEWDFACSQLLQILIKNTDNWFDQRMFHYNFEHIINENMLYVIKIFEEHNIRPRNELDRDLWMKLVPKAKSYRMDGGGLLPWYVKWIIFIVIIGVVVYTVNKFKSYFEPITSKVTKISSIF